MYINNLTFNHYEHLYDNVLIEHIKNFSQTNDVNTIFDISKGSRYTLLMVCTFFHHYQCVKWLLENGADHSLKSGNDNTALTFLASRFNDSLLNFDKQSYWKRHLKFLHLFKKYDVDFNQTGYDSLTPLATLLHSTSSAPEYIFFEYLKNTNLVQKEQINDYKFDILSEILIQKHHDITFPIIDYILDQTGYDINYQNVAHYDDGTNEIIGYNFACHMYILDDKNRSKTNMIKYIADKCHINYDIKEYNNKSILENIIEEKKILALKFILSKHPELIYKNSSGKNLIELCVEKNFIKAIHYFLKEKYISKENIHSLLEFATKSMMIDMIKKINTDYIKEKIEYSLENKQIYTAKEIKKI